MRISRLVIIQLMFLMVCNHCFSQPKLQIVYTRFGILKKYEFHSGDLISYKLKGERKFLTARILALRDSTILFEEDSVGLNQVKIIRFKSENYHIRLFQKLFLIAGIGYPAVTLFNNSMNHVDPVINEKSAIISGSFLAASFLIYRSRIKRIRFTKHKVIKIVDIDFNNLSQP